MYKLQTNFFAGDATFIDDFLEFKTLDEAIGHIMSNKPPDGYEWDIRENGEGGAIVWTRYDGQEVSTHTEGRIIKLRENVL